MHHSYDVLVLGSGIGGSITAALLSKLGWKVLLIEAGTHPRFAVGEATTPDISCRLKLMAHKYELPELDHLTTFHKLRDHVSPACGIKKSFSFLYHREGEKQNPLESHQLPTLAPPLGPDCHFFRQDTDAYMLGVALKYGADVRQNTKITEFDLADDGVTLTSSGGETFHGQFLIDGSGYRSPIAGKLNLRADEHRLRTRSRTLFTHMINVKSYDDMGPGIKAYGLKYKLMEGTLHHVIPGGWMWVIPFNNHPESTNPLCSVGLLLDMDKYPKTNLPPEQEFYQIIGKFPSIAEHFEGAKVVRDWVGTDRLQYGCTNMVGDRYAMLAHAAGFIDPLFSTGMNITLTVIDDLVAKLDDALANQTFSKVHFQPVDTRFQEILTHYDQMVSNAFKSFEDFDLWDAWFRMWAVSNIVGTTLNVNLFFNYLGTKDRSWFKTAEKPPYSGVLGSHFEPHREVFDAGEAIMNRYRAGELTAPQAGDAIRALYAGLNYLPSYFHWHDKRYRSTPTFTLPQNSRLYLWYALHAPKPIRKVLMDWNLWGAYSYTYKTFMDQRRRLKNRKRKFFRETFFANS